MKISWNTRDGVGRFGFHAEPEFYDADPPFRNLYVDRDMLLVSNDVLALAGFLAFGNYCSGSVSLPRKVSPELARSMQEFVDPLWLQVSPIEFEPMKAPDGEGFAFVSDSFRSDAVLPNNWGNPRNVTISVLDSSEWSGHLVATDRLIVASNARMFRNFSTEAYSFGSYLAVALLYMESYRCTTLVVPDEAVRDEHVWSRYSLLLNACKLGLLRESEYFELMV